MRWRLVFLFCLFFLSSFFPPVSSRLILPCAAFLQPANFLAPSLAHFRYSPPHYSRFHLHYRLPSFLFHSFLPAFLRSLSITRSCTFPPRTHTSGCTLSRRPVTQDVVISLGAQFALNVPNERFPTLPFPGRRPLPPLPFSLHSALPS